MFADGSDSEKDTTDQVILQLVTNSVTVDTVACAKNPKTLPGISARTGKSVNNHGFMFA